MTNKSLIGTRINSALALKNFRQKDLAKSLGVTDNTISYFCRGTRTPNTIQLIEIAKVLNVSTDYLLGLTDQPTTDSDLTAVCQYTGLSQKAVENIKQNHSSLTSTILESTEFGEIIDIFVTARHNKNLLHPSGDDIALAVIANAGISVVDSNGTILNEYFDKIPPAFKQALLAIAKDGLSPIYKQDLTKSICSLFDKISDEWQNGN